MLAPIWIRAFLAGQAGRCFSASALSARNFFGARLHAAVMKPHEEFTFPSQRLTLSACAWGDKSAPLTILVHGGLDQKRSWDWTAAALSARYRVVAYDLRGHGGSDWVNDGDYGVMDQVFDLASLAEYLGEDRFHLLGHSLGGNIALRFAGLFPDRIKKLAAIEGLGPSPKMLAERNAMTAPERLLKWIDDRKSKSARASRVMKDYDEALSRMTTAHPHLSPDQLAHLTRTGIVANDDGSVRWAYDPAAMGRSPSDIPYDDFKALLAAINCPVWLAYGEKSWASNPEKDGRAAFLKTATVTEFAGAGHWLHHDSFDAFTARLLSFLDG